ncbi:MAG: LysR family transcriptional regulator [Rhodobacter sp.]|nr:LysR family transcriptional regulator [Rhodobacter sp.]
MRFKRLDLNLLAALDVLLTERNVSRAARKLFLSQSATSGALARLREYFDDDLLVPSGRQLVLTPRARALQPRVRAVLMQIDGTIIQPPEFDPATVRRTVRIQASDYVVLTQLAPAIQVIGQQAPGLTVVLESPQQNAREALDRAEVDLAVLPRRVLAPDHPHVPYFTDDHVVLACARNRDLGPSLTRADYVAARHVTMQFDAGLAPIETSLLQAMGIDRHLAAVSNSFAAVPFLVAGTRHLATLPRRLAQLFATMAPLRILPLPFDLPLLDESLQWHTHAADDACLAWVRAQILACRAP